MEVLGSAVYSAAHDDDDEQQQSGTVVLCSRVYVKVFCFYMIGVFCEEEASEEQVDNDIDIDHDLDIDISDDLLLMTEKDIRTRCVPKREGSL